MKSLVIKLIIAVSGFNAPVDEIESRLSAIAPVRIEVIDLANPQPVEDFKRHYYSILSASKKDAIKIYIHAPYESEGELLFGGHGSYALRTGTAAIIPGRDKENLQLMLHEIGHAVFNLSHDSGCSIMSSVPCGLEFRESDILRAKKFLRRKK